MSEQLELEAQEEQVTTEIVSTPDDPMDKLIWLAVQGNADVVSLEKLIDLKNREEERGAKREFDRQFALMQKDLPTIKKGKPVKDSNGEILYYYAPLDTIQAQCDPVIADYQFSYRWKETALDEGKRITIVISGYGHSEESTFDVPVGQTNKVANEVQAQGSMTTFGHRYTYIAGFGVTVEGSDDDGSLGFDEGVEYSQYIVAMDAETNPGALLELVKGYRKEMNAKGDVRGVRVVSQYYAKCKEQLS